MRAIVVREFGGPEVLQVAEVPVTAAPPGRVRVRVHAIGINPYDTYMRTGQYAKKPPLPYIPGADAAGVVDETGEGVSGISEGQRVWIGGTAESDLWGAYSESVLCHPHQVHPLPDRCSFAQGAAINVAYVTAMRALRDRGQAKAGDTVFVHGASGGVGAAATQIARGIGATVIGSAGSDEGMNFVRSQGAHHVLNHRSAGYLDAVTEITNGKGVDVVVEMLANVNLDQDLSLLAPRGRVVVVGNRGRIEIDPRKLMSKDGEVRGMTLWNVSPDDLTRLNGLIQQGLDNGSLSPAVGRELPLEQAARAHAEIVESTHQGKVVLVT